MQTCREKNTTVFDNYRSIIIYGIDVRFLLFIITIIIIIFLYIYVFLISLKRGLNFLNKLSNKIVDI